ncbi:MAG: ATPase [Deinococcales bacterium]
MPSPELVIFVGLTGAGKSTAVEALLSAVPGALLLPNRRALTDRIVIPEAQHLAGEDVRPVTDRIERFRLTARYREAHPGGMAHALQRYLEDRDVPSTVPLLVFDNLRGDDEVGFAADAFDGARFVVLEAPAEARILRLAGRHDAFDRAAAAPEPAGPAVAAEPSGLAARLADVPGLGRLTDPAALLRAARGLDPDAVLTAARIIAEESAHYDDAAAWARLAALPASRRLRLDTGGLSAAEVAGRLRAWL